MSIPNPPYELEGHCAAVHDDVLYVLSPSGFLSLSLQKKAEWAKETNGVLVTGSACVSVGEGAEAALYVIGGQSDKDDFTGLQRFTFASKQWETLSSISQDVIQQRTNHSIAYLPESQSILVYAGSQPNAPSELSSQTFLISTHSPYNLTSYTSKAPPGNLPILLPWTSESAIMMGGSSNNKELWTFDPQHGWEKYRTRLAAAPSAVARGMIVDVSNGGKVLELYDFSQSPNAVTQIVLQESNGHPAETGQTVGSSSTHRQKRNLSLRKWPTYNSKNAPTATRADCSVSQGSNGLAVVAGGSSAIPVALFNQDENTWLNGNQFFDSAHKQWPLTPSKSPSPSQPSQTATSAVPTSPAPPSSGGTSSQTLHVLGIVLGVLCGVAAIFIFALLYFRYRRIQRRKQQAAVDEKSGERMSFQDRGASFMKEAGGSINDFVPPPAGIDRNYDASHTSMSIIAGKMGNRRNTNGHVQASSFDSTANLVKNKEGEMGEPVEMMNIGDRNVVPEPGSTPIAAKYGTTLTVEDFDAKARRKRSSGWSKYFATSGPTGPNGLSHIPDAYVKSTPVGAPIDQQARTSSTNLLPALDLEVGKTLDGQRLSHVATGSPSFNDSREDLARNGSAVLVGEGQSGLIVDPRRRRSLSESISSYTHSTISSRITSEYYNEGGHLPWTPTTANFHDSGSGRRPTSSMYSSSVYDQRLPSRGKSVGFFPGAGTNYRPPRRPKNTQSELSMDDWPAPPKNTDFTSKTKDDAVGNGETADRPRRMPSAHYAGLPKEPESPGKNPMSSDLTWLDLGNSQNQHRI